MTMPVATSLPELDLNKLKDALGRCSSAGGVKMFCEKQVRVPASAWVETVGERDTIWLTLDFVCEGTTYRVVVCHPKDGRSVSLVTMPQGFRGQTKHVQVLQALDQSVQFEPMRGRIMRLKAGEAHEVAEGEVLFYDFAIVLLW